MGKSAGRGGFQQGIVAGNLCPKRSGMSVWAFSGAFWPRVDPVGVWGAHGLG